MNEASFNNLPENILKSVARLNTNSDFIDYMEWLKDGMIAESLRANKIDNELQRNRLDGRVQMLDILMDINQKAKGLLEEIKHQEIDVLKSGAL